jgi:ubiquinone/menaquinone biosynthesis C-methylase UbiE
VSEPFSSGLTWIAESFDLRAADYPRSDWHRVCAERVVLACGIKPGDVVLDAATGTGFAAIAAAARTGPAGGVIGVDVSEGMLRQAQEATANLGIQNVELVKDDATRLSRYADGSFDAVTCAAGLLYMHASTALREWRRLLRPGGRVAFSTMRAGSPLGARVFRDTAATFGLALRDPSEELGSEAAAQAALAQAGFDVVSTVAEPVEFTMRDRAMAWAANFRSAAHEDVQRLSEADRDALRRAFLAALADIAENDPLALASAEVLYVVGRR